LVKERFGREKSKIERRIFILVDTTVVPFFEWGKPYQYIAIRSDITERKQFEEDFSTLIIFHNWHGWLMRMVWCFGIISAGLITPAHIAEDMRVGRKFTIQTIYNEW
jgi:hypothetical protein